MQSHLLRSSAVYLLGTRIAAVVSTVAVLIRLIALVLELLRYNAGVLAGLLPYFGFGPGALAFCLELVTASTELCDGLLRQKLLQRPLLDVLRLVLLELCDKLNGALKDGALVLFTTGDNLG